MRLLTSSLLLASALLFVGCAVDGASEIDTDESAQTQDEITKASRPYVGTWSYQRGIAGTTKHYDQISLRADGSYDAYRAPECPPGRMCPMYILSEKGTWSATKKRLTLRTSSNERKVFAATISADGFGLELSNANGRATFRRQARLGESCGGFRIDPVVCEAGLVCFGEALAWDGPGTCTKPVAAGQSCGFRKQTKPCEEGLECRWNGGPRDSLACVAATPEGKFCGGFAGIQCPSGSRCVLDGSFPDAGGHCELCPLPPCAAPPEGCRYEQQPVPAGECPVGCGKLVCDGTP